MSNNLKGPIRCAGHNPVRLFYFRIIPDKFKLEKKAHPNVADTDNLI